MEKPQLICHAEKSTNFSVYDARWIPCSAKFVVLGSKPRGTGAIQLYEISEGDVKLLKETEKDKAFKCGTFGASSLRERHLATGDFDGNLNIWNVDDTTSPVYTAAAHKEIINCIDGVGGPMIGSGAPELVTGSRDGSVKVWDSRQKGKPVATMEPAAGEDRRDCWAVAFGNSYNSEERVVCAGYDNGDIKMFDLRMMTLRWEINVKNGAHKSTVWTVRHLPQNREIFVTCGGGGTLCLWNNYPEKRTKEDGGGDLVGVAGSVSLLQNVTLSSQPISSFDWSPDKQGLAVCTAFDQTVRVIIATKLSNNL
uniref:WD repeat-containing protein 92 n=1 Tax=Timema shepardi TaxID=629360 RepID=A0A7R9FYX5_TIMSH|nr:unnamed protein product [Timema shepardi]